MSVNNNDHIGRVWLFIAGNTTRRSKGNRRNRGNGNTSDSDDDETWWYRMMTYYELRANGPKGKLYLYQGYWYSPDHDQ